MKIWGKIGGVVALAIAPMVLALPAEAGGRGGFGYGHKFHSGHGGMSVFIGKSFGSGYRGRGHFRRHHHGHGGIGKTGHALLGFGIGYVLGNVIADQRPPRERVIVRERPIPARTTGTGWYQPPQRQVQQPPAPQGTCLQTREYTTTVTIGGAPADAYGTACLQPDGSWRFGPPQPVPR